MSLQMKWRMKRKLESTPGGWPCPEQVGPDRARAGAAQAGAARAGAALGEAGAREGEKVGLGAAGAQAWLHPSPEGTPSAWRFSGPLSVPTGAPGRRERKLGLPGESREVRLPSRSPQLGTEDQGGPV